MYRRIGFEEPPFIEAGAATNVTPYIPENLLKRLNAMIECALSGQCSPLMLGGAAGSGKTTITKYYFMWRIHEEFGEKLANSLVTHYTITDTDELRDVPVFYERLIRQVLDRVKQNSPEVYADLQKDCSLEEHIKSKDTKEMFDLFKDINKFLGKRSPLVIYVIDEIDYVVDLIKEKDYTFIEHLRHMIDLFSEMRHVVLVLASTKLPASYIRMTFRQALGPVADRISESIELRYSEEDFLNFVKIRFKEPIIEEKNGELIERPIRHESRDPLEKDYGVYFPFTEAALRSLYRKEKGQGVTIERLRALERKLAKLTNIYCSGEYAVTKNMKAGKIFEEKDIRKFLTLEEALIDRTPSISLTPKEEEWFTEFFGFRSEHYLKFAHEKCVSAITQALFRYIEGRQGSPGIFPTNPIEIADHMEDTKKGLKFFAYSSGLDTGSAGSYNLGVGITLLREDEIEVHGWDSLKEVIDTLYGLTPLPQKKILLFCVEDDFKFAEIALDLAEHLRSKEKEMCVKDEDIESIKVANDKLMIRSANSFQVIFIKDSNILDILSICAKRNKNEIRDIGDQHFQSIYHALHRWGFPYDFYKYSPSMERILQSAILAPAILGKSRLTEPALKQFFNRIKIKRDRFDFAILRLNGFIREAETGIFKISIPPVLTYLLKNYRQFRPTDIHREFGESMGKEVVEFLISFLAFEEDKNLLNAQDIDFKDIISSTKKTIGKYVEVLGSENYSTHLEVIEKLENADFEGHDQEFGIKASAGFILTERVAAGLVEAVQSQVESEIRRARTKEPTTQEKFGSMQSGSGSEQGLVLEPPREDLKIKENAFLQYVAKPKTWKEIRRKYPVKTLQDDALWSLLKKLHEKNKILVRVKKRGT